MFTVLIQKLKYLDSLLTQAILQFLKPSGLQYTTGNITKELPLFIKITFYLIIILIPFLVWKLIRPLNRQVNIIIVIILFLIGVFAFGIFLGFFQILY